MPAWPLDDIPNEVSPNEVSIPHEVKPVGEVTRAYRVEFVTLDPDARIHALAHHAIALSTMAVGADANVLVPFETTADMPTRPMTFEPGVEPLPLWIVDVPRDALGTTRTVGAAMAASNVPSNRSPYGLGITVAVPIELVPPVDVPPTDFPRDDLSQEDLNSSGVPPSCAPTGLFGDPFALLRAIFGSSSDESSDDSGKQDAPVENEPVKEAAPFEDVPVAGDEDGGEDFDLYKPWGSYNPWDNNDEIFDEDEYDVFVEEGDDSDAYDVYVDGDEDIFGADKDLDGDDDEDVDGEDHQNDEDEDMSDFGDDYALIDDVDDEINDNYDDLGAGIGHPDTTLDDYADPDESPDSDWDASEYE